MPTAVSNETRKSNSYNKNYRVVEIPKQPKYIARVLFGSVKMCRLNNGLVAEDEPAEVESEAQPYRLGLGAKVSRQSKFQPSNDPVKRKLHAKLDAQKRSAAKSAKESTHSTRDGHDHDDGDEDDFENRTSAFVKKRAVPLASTLQSTKKQR